MKVFRPIVTFAVALASTFAFAPFAEAQTAAQPHTSQPSLGGTWTMSLIGDHVIPVGLVIEQNGAALKSTVTLMGKDYAFTGELAGATFALKGQGPAFGRAAAGGHGPARAGQPADPQRASPTGGLADMTIKGTLNGDGTLAGEMLSKVDDRTGTIKWTAERLKERKVPNDAAASTASVNMTGKWTLAITEAQLKIDVDLQHHGSNVTGTATSDHLGAMKLEGTLVNGVLKFATAGSPGGQPVKIDYTGKYKADGSFAGDLSSPMGTMTWSLAPVKK